jgi:hypothetical protein
MSGKIKDKFLSIQSWGRQDSILLIVKQEELVNLNAYDFGN